MPSPASRPTRSSDVRDQNYYDLVVIWPDGERRWYTYFTTSCSRAIFECCREFGVNFEIVSVVKREE